MYSHCYGNRSNHFLRLSPLSVCWLCIIHRICHMLSEASVPISVCGSTRRHVFINYIVIYLTLKKKTNRENNSVKHNLLKSLPLSHVLNIQAISSPKYNFFLSVCSLLLLAAVSKARNNLSFSQNKVLVQQSWETQIASAGFWEREHMSI